MAIADVVTPATADVYRQQLRGCLLVHLTITLAEAHRRAATRLVWLTEEEFDQLHRADAEDPSQIGEDGHRPPGGTTSQR